MQDINKMKVHEIKGKLTELGVEFDDKLNKPELVKLLKDNFKKGESTRKKYIVIHDFKDLKDNNTIYIKGDIYPRRADAKVDDDRIRELSSTNNKIGKVLIKEQE